MQRVLTHQIKRRTASYLCLQQFHNKLWLRLSIEFHVWIKNTQKMAQKVPFFAVQSRTYWRARREPNVVTKGFGHMATTALSVHAYP